MSNRNIHRKMLLVSLIGFEAPLNDALVALSAFEWDSEHPLATLSRQEAVDVLTRFLAGRLSGADVTEWAEAIEAREDIGFEVGYAEILQSFIEELANPMLYFPLSRLRAQEWLLQLQHAPEVERTFIQGLIQVQEGLFV